MIMLRVHGYHTQVLIPIGTAKVHELANLNPFGAPLPGMVGDLGA